MQIFVRKSNESFFSLEVESSETVGKLKDMIHEIECFHPLWQILLYNEKELEDGRTLADCSVQHLSTVNLSRRVGEGWNPNHHRLQRF